MIIDFPIDTFAIDTGLNDFVAGMTIAGPQTKIRNSYVSVRLIKPDLAGDEYYEMRGLIRSSLAIGGPLTHRCYYNSDLFGLVDTQATPLTNERMKDMLNYVEWDFENTWGMDDGEPEGYTPEELNFDGFYDLLMGSFSETGMLPPGDEQEIKDMMEMSIGSLMMMLFMAGMANNPNTPDAPGDIPPGLLSGDVVSFKLDGQPMDLENLTEEEFMNIDPTKNVTIAVNDYSKLLQNFKNIPDMI